MIVGACVALAVLLAVFVVPIEGSTALATEPLPHASSLDETYAGWTREQLLEALEQRKSVALTLKDTLLEERVSHGDFEEEFDQGPSANLAITARADAVASRIDTTPTGDGRILRRTYILRGQDAELDRLVDEISWLMARTGSPGGE
jgi:hypothetical protein